MVGRSGPVSWIAALLALLVAACSGSTAGGGEPDAGAATDIASPSGDTGSSSSDVAAQPPTARIVVPLPNAQLPFRQALRLEGEIGDPADPPAALVATWTSDVGGTLGTSVPSSTGVVTLDLPAETLPPGAHHITLSVTNRAGLKATAEVSVAVNHPPGAPVVAIAPDPAGTADTLRAEIVTEGTDEDGDRVRTARWVWRKDGAVQSALESDSVPGARTRRGEAWEVRVVPTDGTDEGDFGSASIVIANTPPTADGAAVNPSAGDGYTPFTCRADGLDDVDEGDPLQVFVTWRVNGDVVPVEGRCEPACETDGDCAAERTCAPSGHCVVEDWACADACEPPATVCRAGVCVRGCAERGCPDGLVCHEATGRCAPAAGDCAIDSDCPVDETHPAGTVCVARPDIEARGLVSKGDALVCVVTPFDGLDLGASVASGAATVVNAAPEVHGVRLEPEDADVLTAFRCSVDEAVDPDGDEVRLDYLWQVKGPCGACVFETLPGTTSTTLVNPPSGALHFEKGDRVRCQVQPDDGSGSSGLAGTSNEVLVGNAPPLYGSVSIEPAPTATENDVIVCVPNDPLDPDGDGVSPASTVWWVDGEVVAGVTGDRLDGTWFDKGDVVECGVIATDGYDEGELVESKVATRIVNMAPRVAAAHLTPPVGAADAIYTCAPQGWFDGDPPDADGPGVSAAEPGVDVTAPEYRFRWYRGGVDQQVAVNQATFGPVDLGVGEVLQCSVTPFDGQDAGDEVRSNEVRMPGPPTIASVTVAPPEPRTADALVCTTHGVEDPDGDEVALAYEWLRDDAVVAGYDTDTLPAAATTKGETWACRVTPSDATGAGAPATSAPVAIANTPPAAPLVAVEPPGAGPGAELSCVIVEESADPDGDDIEYAYQWSLDGDDLDGETGATIVSDPTVGCGAWRCTVTPSDDGGPGAEGAGEVLTASGTALRFDGASDFAEIGHTAALSLAPLGTFTIEAWVRPETLSAGTIARKGADGGAGFDLRLDADGAARIAVATSGGATTVTAAAPLPPDRWAHVAASYNGSLVFLFVNGLLQDTATLTGSADSAAAIYLGGQPDGGPDGALHGRVDEVRLSSEAIYTASFSPTLPLEAGLGVIGLWHLDEGQGTLFHDDSGGGSAGARVGAEWVEGMCVPSRNQPPQAPVVQIVPDPAYDDSDLTCAILVESFDPDDDAVDYAVTWALDDAPQPAWDGLWSVPGTATEVGDRWTCRVVPSDGLLEGPAAFAEALIAEQSTVVSGTYDIVPGISYGCAFGLVDLSYTRFTLVDNGISVRVTPYMNPLFGFGGCQLYGVSPQGSGQLNLYCLYAGTCDEEYFFTATFTDPTTFEATLEVEFSGGDCQDCTNQLFTFTGHRVQ